jgi:exodeoxyribonuclease V gamma subunit
MSVLHLASDVRSLAAKLADAIEQQARDGDPFEPIAIVVPNRYQRKWLRLWLARRLGVAINLQFELLDDALWSLLRRFDPRTHPSPPENLDENAYRLLVLSVLLEEKDAALAPLLRYLQMQSATLSRLTCRRAWHLADRLGTLLQEYEFHRQDQLIQPWLRGESALAGASEFHTMMERAQRTLFQHLAMPKTGRRALLNRNSKRRFETLPQYFLELESLEPATLATPPTVHCFGFSQVTPLHTRILAWLGRRLDVRFYHLNVLADRINDRHIRPQTLQGIARALLAGEQDEETRADRGFSLVRSWGKAGIETLGMLGELVEQAGFDADVLPAYSPPKAKRTTRQARKTPARGDSVLSRLQDQLLGKATGTARIAQDTSLQIVGCAGAPREAETVYHSILHNLREHPDLRQTDIAVLVTDMAKYRPALQAVFERPPLHLQYNLVDFNASGLSTFGQAVVGMLDLALESFSRTRVFEVLLNPCFLARLGIDRGAATAWLGWAETLGICQGWDADEKQEQGYPRSPFYAWRLGLQRLRLGRFMEIGDDTDEPAPRFGHVIPFADLDSSDRAQLDSFCRAVEGLLPMLARLRSMQGTGYRWARELQRLVQEFLAVPDDRREEEQVRVALLAAFERLELWDHLHDRGDRAPGLPLALVREYVRSQLVDLEGNKGEYLVGGVTIAELQPMRPVPFAIVYIVGLSEDLFPGGNQLSTFDLRGPFRQPGDIRPAEDRQYQFLEAVLAAQRKLYLIHNNLDVQKDQPLQPAVPLQQLQRYLKGIVRHDFQAVSMPMHNTDERFYRDDPAMRWQDVLVQYRDADRYLAYLTAQKEQRLDLDLNQQAELEEKRQQMQADFMIVADPAVPIPKTTTVSVSELKRFLQFPAKESMRRHLHVDEAEETTRNDDEPLVTAADAAFQLLRQSLQQLVMQAGAQGADVALASWQDRFAATYTDSRLRSQVPEEAFGEIDRATLQRELNERIQGQGQLEAFLRNQAPYTFCGPVLLGESSVPLGARLRFPALLLRPGKELPADAPQEIRVVGSTNFAWHSDRVWQVLVVSQSRKIDANDLHASMLEPVLLFFAMLACDEINLDGVSPRKWLEKRDFVLSVAHREGIATWTYPAGSVTPKEAVDYFVALTADYLDPTRFDLLPLEILGKSLEMKKAYQADTDVQLSEIAYQQLIEDVLAEERDNAFNGFKIPLLVDMVQAQVPADALQRVRRWFRLIDRGPARVRQQRAAGGRAPRRGKP